VAVSGSGQNFYALDADGILWAWGVNSHGELGIGTTQSYSTPQRVGEAEGLIFASISVGYDFVLAIGKPVPEPVSLVVLGVGAVGVLSRRRR